MLVELILLYFKAKSNITHPKLLDSAICLYNSFTFMYSNIPVAFWMIHFNLSLLLIYKTGLTL